MSAPVPGQQPAGTVGPSTAPGRRARRWLRRTLIVMVLLLLAGELFARFGLGLGDPPLLQTDPEIEYLFKPDQDCRRFGNRIKYNHFSMRADDVGPRKNDPRELRVLVVGDSVVNGGVLTDQSELATAILQRELAARLSRPVFVGNVSAGSWGPPNELAYLKRFGLFDADVVVLVFSSHDAFDAPTFDPAQYRNPAFVTRRPVSALWEGVTRYALPRLGLGERPAEILPTPAATDAARTQCLGAAREIVRMARAAHAAPLIALHREQKEQPPNRDAQLDAEHDAFVRLASDEHVPVIELGEAFRAATAAGGKPYRDDIHPSAAGQKLLADQLLPVILGAVRR